MPASRDITHPVFRLTPVAAAVVATLSTTLPAHAADQQLRDTVVTAARHETDTDSLTATVTSITRKDLDRRMPTDDADLFTDEPDIAMARDLRRHGSTRVNIRGVEDTRVVQMIDGVRLPDYYNGGGPTNITMNAAATAMPDFLRQVEIVRGPASSLYGSDAIGGVVGYVTLEPGDIATGEKREGLRLRTGYSGASDTFSASAIGALRGEGIDLLVGYAEAHGHETDNKGNVGTYGATRSQPNELTSTDRGFMTKLITRPAVGHRFSATLEAREQEVQSDIKRIPNSLRRISQMLGDDSNRRVRGSLEWEHKPTTAFYDRMIARAYHQDSDTHNHNFQIRSGSSLGGDGSCSASGAGANNCSINQDFYFRQKTTGLGLQFETALKAGNSQHFLTYGIDLMRQRIDEKRDGTVLVNNTTTVKSLGGEAYPLRDFPIGVTDTIGLYLQDEISLADNRLTVTPAIRYDHTHLKPILDAMSQSVLTAIGRQAVSQTHGAFSPKIGAQWKLTEALATYGQLAAGFRAPNYQEVNGSFRNTSQNYATAPSPNLKPETSIGLELGLRARTASARGQLAVYDNHYTNYIENQSYTCPGNPACIGSFRTTIAENLPKARIYGAEARGNWEFARGWRIDGGLAWAHGTNETSNKPLNTIEPLRLSLGLTRDAGSWGSEVRLRAASRKNRIDDTKGTTSTDPVYYRTPGYGVTDIAAWIKPGRDTQITAGINNLFDKKYWLWSDIRQADAAYPTSVDFYTQPGRTFRVALQVDF